MTEFVQSISDYLRFDSSTFPATVELISAAKLGAEEGNSAGDTRGPMTEKPSTTYDRGRIRDDLWQAVIDWQINISYVWDPGGQCVKKVRQPAPEVDVLPRLSKAEFDALRNSFTENVAGSLEDKDRKKLQAWRAHKLPTNQLPKEVLTIWYKSLTNEVETRLKE